MTPYEIFVRTARDVDAAFADLSYFVDTLDAQFEQHAAGQKPESELFAELFPHLFHSSLCVSLVSLLEHEMRGYCQALQTALNIPLAISDLNGNWVERFHKYTRHLAGLEFELSESDWRDMGALVEMRNCIVHNGGVLDGFAKASVIREFASKNGSPAINHGRLSFSRESTLHIMGTGGRFLGCVLNAGVDRFRTPDGPPIGAVLDEP